MFAKVLMPPLTSASPQGLAGLATGTPSAPRAAASGCWTLRSVPDCTLYSALRLTKPETPRGRPRLPETTVTSSLVFSE